MKKKPDNVVMYPASMPYPTNLGAPKFEPVPVADIKDRARNVARYHANEKLDELNEQYQLVLKQAEMIRKQAEAVVDRINLTDAVLAAEYQFVPVAYKTYYLVYDSYHKINRLVMNGQNEWATGAPDHWDYMASLRLLGDGTWERIKD
jgi:hypothetical protein